MSDLAPDITPLSEPYWKALEEGRARGQSDVLLEALGWFGDLSCVEFLVEQLRTGEPTAKAVAAEALHRLTGAGLTEAHPAREYPEDAQPLLPRPGAPSEPGPLLLEADPWAAWWARYRRNADARKRYRHGHLWTPSDDVWQLETPSARTGARDLAHLELVARTGGAVPFDRRDFVVRQ